MLQRFRRRGSTYRNRNPCPNSRAPDKGGFVGAIGQLRLLWEGASRFTPATVAYRNQNFVTCICHTKISGGRARCNATETATPSPNRAHLTKGGSWVLWGSWGCCGVLRFRPATVAYRNPDFRSPPYQNRQRARPLQRHRNRISGSETAPRKPKSRSAGKGRSVGAVGQLGLLWGASVPTRTGERRLVTKIKFWLSALRFW